MGDGREIRKDERDISDLEKESGRTVKNGEQWIRCKIALRYAHKKATVEGKLAQKHSKAAK